MKALGLHLRGSNEWLEVVEGVLEFIPAPALIAAPTDHKIIAANSAAVQAGGFSETSLKGYRLCRLFPEISRWVGQNLPLPKSVFTLFQPYGRPAVQVLWQASPLGDSGRYWLVTFQEQAEPKTKFRRPLPTQCFKGWQRLAYAWGASSFAESVTLLLQGMEEMLGSEWSAVYLPEGNLLRLNGVNGAPPALPTELPVAAIAAFSEPMVHRPSRGDSTPLHLAVRTSPTPYFLSLPLKSDGGGLAGMMAFGYYHLPPPQAVEYAKETVGIASKVISHLKDKETRAHSDALLRQLLGIKSALTSHMTEGLLLFGVELRLKEMNAAAEKMLGYTAEEVIGYPLADLLPANTSTEAEARIALVSGQVRETEAYLLRHDGNDFPARVRFVPYPQAGGKRPEGLLVLIADRSEATKYLAQSKQLERRAMLGDVMASFAHEVRNPLNSIGIGIQWLALNADPNSPEYETLNSLQEDVERLNHLVKNLLNYTRARPLQFKPVDVAQLINQIMRRLKPRFDKYKIQTEVRIGANIPKVNGDRLTLEQAFVNILDNAIKALAEQEDERFIAVRVLAHKSPEGTRWVEVDIMDTGPGFSEEAKKRLFEPFFTTRKDGTGLGLAITKQIITAHRGNIEAESYPGGTIFRVKLRAVGGNSHGV